MNQWHLTLDAELPGHGMPFLTSQMKQDVKNHLERELQWLVANRLVTEIRSEVQLKHFHVYDSGDS